MADDNLQPGVNGSGPDAEAPQAAVLAQYIKDLSVESPSAPQVFQWQDQPRLEVQFNINVDQKSDEVHEVVLKVEAAAKSDNGIHFLVDLSYAGLFGLRGAPQEAVPAFLLVEAPRMLFPFVRQIVADATLNAGFPPLLLDPVDFNAAFLARLQAAQQQSGEGDAPAPDASSTSNA
jgi:preprotein translocase subunit SecB